jgi:phosphohistidine phosphatase SixA
MIVTILRHGEAGTAATDAERALTPQGIDDISFGSQRFRDTCEARGVVAASLILHSPWLRTTQTAEILANVFPDAVVASGASLKPGGRIDGVTDSLLSARQQHGDFLHLVLVSHQPMVSEWVDYFLGFPHSVPSLCPGGLVTIDIEVPARDCGRLIFWALPPQYEAGQ